MKNWILNFSIVLILFSCENTDDYNGFKKENHLLKVRIDSLENWINNSFDPIIIENNRNKILNTGDTANFVVGLLMNDEKIIDSIEISLFKIRDSNQMTFIKKSLAFPNSDNKENYGFEYFSLPNLSQGNYLYRGNVFYHGKRIPIEHYFSVFK